MSKNVVALIARIRSRQKRVADRHPDLTPEARGLLGMTLNLAEAGALADQIDRGRGLTVGRFFLCAPRYGKIGIITGDGEGGEFPETALAAVLEKFYRENF